MERKFKNKTILKRQLGKIAKLSQAGPFIAGSLNRVETKSKSGKVSEYYLLTYKEEQTTKSVYVPKDLVKEVSKWVQNYRRLKNMMENISADSIQVIRQHAGEKREENARNR